MWHTYYITNYMRLVREWLGAGKTIKNGNKLVVAWALMPTQDMLA